MQIVDFAKKRVVESRKSSIFCCRIVEIEGHCRWRNERKKVCRMQNLVVKKLQNCRFLAPLQMQIYPISDLQNANVRHLNDVTIFRGPTEPPSPYVIKCNQNKPKRLFLMDFFVVDFCYMTLQMQEFFVCCRCRNLPKLLLQNVEKLKKSWRFYKKVDPPQTPPL